ncbi:hypothetical protein AHiyo8_pI68480 (plasmid) [Arthrobacter sp. Hiyo8]|uniref:hypothetical protein n=1 Tax=Arthrobacter sp. Hiyo1 TaxID=1588020 RepID=UPI000683AB45|nr:hypothetical protein [Arthrobacter sp. Hiyo1]BAS18544.1 hypothetical protein AHiyo8_pI68480 [Arthrobacter sp. Hiyo8]GAP60726.1 hypothetical protein AHiyo1_43070 [Arthrobacter sp. Hiyo1]
MSIWTSLEPGDVVTLSLQGYEHHRGTVDDRTADGRTIWVIDRLEGRRLFHIDDGYDLRVGATTDAAAGLPVT